MLNLADLAIFSQVAETKSFSAAAARLGLSKGTVSKHIVELEAALNARLLHRTTRKVSLTDAGAALYQHCVRIMAEAEQAATAIIRSDAALQGLLAVAAPTAIGVEYVVPAIADVLATYRDLVVDLSLTNRPIDLAVDRVDLAIRIASTPDTSLVWRPIMACPTAICAAPSYLARHGTPISPDDLKRHSWLRYAVPALSPYWRLHRNEREYIISASGRFCSDSGEALRLAALRGLGVALIPRFFVEEELSAGRLVQVLEDYTTQEYTAYIVHPFAHRTSAAILTLSDRVAELVASSSTRKSASFDLVRSMPSRSTAEAAAVARP